MGTKEICDVAKNYFQSLLKSKAEDDAESFLSHIPSCVMPAMNLDLDKVVTEA